MNHTSEDHEWARKARAGEPGYRERYFFYDNWDIPREFEKTVPQVFPTTAPGSFTWLDDCKQVVMTNFYPYQWDLNYANPVVFNDMTENLLYLTNRGIDVIRLDAVPYIGKYSRLRPYWYVASGFQKWGMTGSMVSALILRNLVMGIESPWEQVFSPQRWTWKASAGSFLKEGYHALRGLTASGRQMSAYGCRLSWNQEEHSWDCPCHGSRFSENGSLIDNPAQTDLKADKR